MIGLAVRVGIATIIVAGIGGGFSIMAGPMVIGITFGLMFIQ